MAAVKVLIIIALLLLLFLPMLPLPLKMRRFSTFYALRYRAPHNRLNAFFIILTAVEFAVVAVVYNFARELVEGVASVPFIASLLAKTPSLLDFSAFMIGVLLLNLVILYLFVFLKSILKKLLDSIYGFKKEEKKEKKAEEKAKKKKAKKEKAAKKRRRVPSFLHSEDSEEEEDKSPEAQKEREKKAERFEENHPILAKLRRAWLGLFFEGKDFLYARRWVLRVRSVLQLFIYFVEIVYFVFFFAALLALFFRMPTWFYDVVSIFQTKMYVFPFISLLFLQEICNTFYTEAKVEETGHEAVKKEEEAEAKRKNARLEALRAKLLRRFGKEHKIRYYPEAATRTVRDYECANKTYRDALTYIREQMKVSSGRVVQSYMEGLDSVFNGHHVYFGASFYSLLGEYIIAYTYIRLLAGERQIFIVSDRQKVDSLVKFIGRRLTELTGTRNENTWRVYSAGANINEADVLIAVPEDFETDNLVENYQTFFEEACNAVFIDADRILNLDSYLCTIMASRLQVATRKRIRFLFMSRDIIQGFCASLKKFFCINEEIVECSSPEENENVAYMLWNRESEIVYHRDGQRLATLEGMIAEEAYHEDVDGIRILTSVPLSATEKEEFVSHRIEINEFHKEVPEVNYMICTDDRCNLAAALYAYTRFHGKRASILHILSKPYLLREYFTDKAEEYVNRSAFIKPRVTEHAEEDKLMLLRLLCDATAEQGGMPVSFFSAQIAKAMAEDDYPQADGTAAEVAYLIEKLTGEEHTKFVDGDEKLRLLSEYREAPANERESWRTAALDSMHDYFGLLNASSTGGYQLRREKHITFLKIDTIFAKLLRHNKRVELYLNGALLGRLDTFPERVYQQFLPGQSIIFDNCEYEIESIEDGGAAIYLRQENITYNSCMDTALLRRYRVDGMKEIEDSVPGVYHCTTGALEKICVDYRRAHVYGETYGFYNLMANSQTLDFVGGVVGNPALDDRIVASQARDLKNGLILSVRLYSRGISCTDGMRKLLAAVLSEFIRTMFPDAFRCIAVCPVLKESTDATGIDGDFNKQVETLYPYLVDTENSGLAAEDNCAELLIINDATEDIGVLDMLYDGAARIMEEVFSYIMDYFVWLRNHEKLPKGQSHYIYFGSDKLPEIYDLDGCITLLENCIRKFDDEAEEETQKKGADCCAFCRAKLERGRYSSFDKSRFICFDCEVTVVCDSEKLSAVYDKVCDYWRENYPEIPLPENVGVEFDGVYDLDEKAAADNHYYRTDSTARKIFVERDNPENNVFVSILRGLIFFWQNDNKLIVAEAEAQLAFEERRYLRTVGNDEGASYTVKLLDTESRNLLVAIKNFVAKTEGATSFDYMLNILKEIEEEENVDVPVLVPEDNEGADALFDPDLVPRFWKRYLRGEHATDDNGDAESMLSDGTMKNAGIRLRNAPPPPMSDEDDDLDQDILDANEDDVSEEEYEDEDTADTEEDTADDTPEDTPKKPEKTKEKPKKPRFSLGHLKTGIELVPYEEEEKTNKNIRLYNEIARRIADYSREPISIAGITDEMLQRIYYFVLHDYPEFFWVQGYSWNRGTQTMQVSYRCTVPGTDEVDVAKVNKYRKDLRRHVKYFTKGITPATKPYDAMLTIYRRLVLSLDYEDAGLEAGAGRDRREDDTLRSLYSALVKRKVVCVGYAVAMQYLLQSVGICCGCITSKTHEWNVVKFGRHCYHLDVTWADGSTTKGQGKNKNKIFYNYCCVTSEANCRAGDERVPETDVFKGVEDFCAIKHEYFHAKNAFLTSYNEDQIAALFATAVTEKPFEDSARCAAFRCRDKRTMELVMSSIQNGGYWRIIDKARAIVGPKNKKALKLLEKPWPYFQDKSMCTVHFFAD